MPRPTLLPALPARAALGCALALAGALLTAVPLAEGAEKPKTELTWYGQSAFVVKTPKGTVIAIDPWLANPQAADKAAASKIARLDYIVITHGHADHVGDAIELGKRTGARLVTVIELANALVAAGYPKEAASMATNGNMGGTIQLGEDASVTLVPAAHSSTYQKDPTSPPVPAGNPVGVVLRIAGGPTLYHTGDTDVTSEMERVADRFKVDVMLACIGGHFTMDPRGAALAASLVKPREIVPMHFGTFPLLAGTPAQLKSELKARGVKATVTEMKVGETRKY